MIGRIFMVTTNSIVTAILYTKHPYINQELLMSIFIKS